jgi:DNA protecting protein DprA
LDVLDSHGLRQLEHFQKRTPPMNMIGDVNNFEAIVALSYLGFDGRSWPAIEAAGGPREFLETSPVHKDSIEKALEWCLPRLKVFQRNDGGVLGAKGFREMARFARAPRIPLCVFTRGELTPFMENTLKVGIVGTRKPSDSGIRLARNYAADLARAGHVIVSGGAWGIDMAAHEGAIQAGGLTICGLAEVVQLHNDERPKRLRGLAPRKLLTTFTTLGPRDRTYAASFVERNQYVAALCDAVIVVEGQSKSGTIHTARFAHRMSIPVFAVLGDSTDGLDGAAKALIAEGIAKPLNDMDEFVKSMGMDSFHVEKHQAEKPEANRTEGELPLYAHQKIGQAITCILKNAKSPLSVDDLCVELEIPAADIHPALFELELTDQIKRRGAFFVLS